MLLRKSNLNSKNLLRIICFFHSFFSGLLLKMKKKNMQLNTWRTKSLISPHRVGPFQCGDLIKRFCNISLNNQLNNMITNSYSTLHWNDWKESCLIYRDNSNQSFHCELWYHCSVPTQIVQQSAGKIFSKGTMKMKLELNDLVLQLKKR